jgi:hypothetical protein
MKDIGGRIRDKRPGHSGGARVKHEEVPFTPKEK